jgi:hypothetical protein
MNGVAIQGWHVQNQNTHQIEHQNRTLTVIVHAGLSVLCCVRDAAPSGREGSSF